MIKIKKKVFYLLTLKFIYSSLVFSQESLINQEAALEKENQSINNYSKRMQAFYELGKQEKWRDITKKVLASPDTSETSKQSIRLYQRRIIVFKYPSDNLWIKGFISFTPDPTHHPLLILYRWGNENFALMNPGIIFATYKDFTVVSSTLRGGVSEGKDEFGGADVDDMKNLMNFLPQLAQELGIKLHPSCVFMLGPSRGGLEMFLTLAHFPELQDRVNKIVALSAILDLHQLIHDRPNDMKKMFEHQFGLQRGAKEEEWIAKRDPLNTVPFLKRSLPILIIQGTADNRINLTEGYHMIKALKQNGHAINYWEIPHGNHALINTPYIMSDIAHWLESNSPCMSIHLSRQKEKKLEKSIDNKNF
jgi:dipeptidyl aminopeptidase/acylaminoacyl peptidase